MRFIKKALARGITFPNMACWASLEIMRVCGAWWGTMAFRAKASLFGVEFGRNIVCHGQVGLLRWPGGRITIGDDVQIVSSWRRSTAAALAFPARLRVFGPGAVINIGKGAQLTGASITARSTTIAIGEGALLGPNCIIVDSDFHAPWPAKQRAANPGYENDAPVSIGRHVWLGMHSIVLKGVTVGDGAIIGAGSVVSRDIPGNSVACGCPCRVVRQQGADADS